MKLKIRFEKWEQACVMQVLTQTTREKGPIHVNRDFELWTFPTSELKRNIICVSGNKKGFSSQVVCKNFETKREAQRYYQKVINLFQSFGMEEVKPGIWEKVK